MNAATDRQPKEAPAGLASPGSGSEAGIAAAAAAALAFIGGSAFFAMKRTRRGTATRQG